MVRNLLLLAAVVLLGAPGFAQDEPALPRVVTGEWLAANLKDETVKLVDCREDIRDYWKGHIPGAVWVSPEALRWPDCGVPGKFMGRDGFKALLASLGLHQETKVICYADTLDYRATYLAWALDYVKHGQIAVLDGGFKQWQAQQRPVSQDYPTITACPCYWLPPAPNEALRVTLSQVQDGLKDPGTVLLDVRAKDLYTGAKGFWKRNGHIPGAIWHSWQDDVTPEGALKPVAELRAAYAALGVTPDKRVISSCGQGQMSSHTYWVLKYVLGYKNVANYDGGFNEWVSHADLPVATGE